MSRDTVDLQTPARFEFIHTNAHIETPVVTVHCLNKEYGCIYFWKAVKHEFTIIICDSILNNLR